MKIKNLKINKSIVIVLSSFVLGYSITSKLENDAKITIEYEDDSSFLAKYNNGYIAFGNEDYIEAFDSMDSNVIKILDDRNHNDPNVIIYDSYKISNPFFRENVLNLLLDYEQTHPTKWDRSFESLKTEWLLHNIGYYLLYQRNHTTDVDLNNKDEQRYRLFL